MSSMPISAGETGTPGHHGRGGPGKVHMALVSFEGPDGYSMAGGLGQRVSTLACELASIGVETDLFFVGDPNLPGEEDRVGGRLHLHRWCQWISRYHPEGVYQAEEDKRRDLLGSLPGVLLGLAAEDVRRGYAYGMLFEDWQCAELALVTRRTLADAGLAAPGMGQVGHNTNTLMQIQRANLHLLRDEVRLMTVSRFMKHALWNYGVNPRVVPNGLSAVAFDPPDEAIVSDLTALRGDGRTVLVKVARFDPDKAWLHAIEAIRILRDRGARPLLVMRGGVEGHSHDVLRLVDALGLRILDWRDGARLPPPAALPETDIVHVRARLEDAALRGLYGAADVVLAQSAVEPFGLVGLEVMAQGGIAVTGSTGEDYARHRRNALVAETGSPAEIAHLVELVVGPGSRNLRRQLSREGLATARTYTWRAIIPELLERLLGERG